MCCLLDDGGDDCDGGCGGGGGPVCICFKGKGKKEDKEKDKESDTINAILDAIRVMNGGGDDDNGGDSEDERLCCCMMPGCILCCITRDRKKKKKKKDMKRLETLLRQIMNRPGRNPFSDQTQTDLFVDAILRQVGRGGGPMRPERPSVEAMIARIYEQILINGGGRDQTIIGGIVGPNIGCGNLGGGGRSMYPPFYSLPYY